MFRCATDSPWRRSLCGLALAALVALLPQAANAQNCIGGAGVWRVEFRTGNGFNTDFWTVWSDGQARNSQNGVTGGTGIAALNGNQLHIETRAGPYLSVVQAQINADCTTGRGTVNTSGGIIPPSMQQVTLRRVGDAPLRPDQMQRSQVRVLEIRGDVEVSPGGDDSRAVVVRANAIINSFDRIVTGLGSGVRLQFPDGSLVDVGELTDMKVAAFNDAGNAVQTRLWLRGGEVSASVNRSTERPSDFAIKAPNKEAGGVRGTRFTVRHDVSTRQTLFRVDEGIVEVTRGAPAVQAVLARSGAQVTVTATSLSASGPVTPIAPTPLRANDPFANAANDTYLSQPIRRPAARVASAAPPAPLAVNPFGNPPPGQDANATFANPQVNGTAVDWCESWGVNCGQGGADQFCRTQNHARAFSFQTYRPGRTFVIGSQQFCNDTICTGLSQVVCGGGFAAAPAAPWRWQASCQGGAYYTGTIRPDVAGQLANGTFLDTGGGNIQQWQQTGNQVSFVRTNIVGGDQIWRGAVQADGSISGRIYTLANQEICANFSMGK